MNCSRIASLVEKEGAKTEDRKKIAGVFYNRLNQDMPFYESNIAILMQKKLGQKTLKKIQRSIQSTVHLIIFKNTDDAGPVDNPGVSA